MGDIKGNAQLKGLGLIDSETSFGRGRPATLWANVGDAKPADAEAYGA